MMMEMNAIERKNQQNKGPFEMIEWFEKNCEIDLMEMKAMEREKQQRKAHKKMIGRF